MLNPFMLNGLFYCHSMHMSISSRRGSGKFMSLPCLKEIPVFNANSLDHDQTPYSVASDLGLHDLAMSLLWDARFKWVN